MGNRCRPSHGRRLKDQVGRGTPGCRRARAEYRQAVGGVWAQPLGAAPVGPGGFISRDSWILSSSSPSSRPGPWRASRLDILSRFPCIVGCVLSRSPWVSALVVASGVDKDKGNTTKFEDRNRATRVGTTDPRCTPCGPRALARRIACTFKLLFSKCARRTSSSPNLSCGMVGGSIGRAQNPCAP